MFTSEKYLWKYISPVENCMFLGDFNAEIMPKDFFNHLIDLYWSAISKDSASLSLLIVWGQWVHCSASRFHWFVFVPPGELQGSEILFCMLLSKVMHLPEKPIFPILYKRQAWIYIGPMKKKVCEWYFIFKKNYDYLCVS